MASTILIHHHGRHYGTGTTRQRQDDARHQSGNTAIAGFDQRAERAVRSQPEDGGQVHDASQALALIAGLAPRHLIANKAYDSHVMLDALGARPIIPKRTCSKRSRDLDPEIYQRRNLTERVINKLKQFRRIATRYDKLAANFTAMIKLASIRLWLRAYEPTA